MLHIEAGLALARMIFDDLQDAAGHVCTKRDFVSANGDDDEEEEEEEEKKKKERDEEDEEDEEGDDDDDGAIDCLSRQARKVEQDIAGLLELVRASCCPGTREVEPHQHDPLVLRIRRRKRPLL
jgi:hypothetical protein